jgi:transposase
VPGRTLSLRLPTRRGLGCGSFMACGPAGYRGEAWLEKGLLSSKQRCPSSLTKVSAGGGEGDDGSCRDWDGPAQAVTIEARDTREVLRAVGTFPMSTAGYRAMLQVARQWPERMWAVEGANGVGRPVAQRLLADAERVLDVPAKLAARARVFDTGQGRKTDAADAHAVVMVALRDKGLRELAVDADLQVLRLLCDRRDELSKGRAQGLNRAHRLFAELLPGGAPAKKSVVQYRALLATVRPRDQVGRTRRRLVAEELAELARIDAKVKTLKAELRQAVQALGSHLMDIHGIGPVGAARILADVGDVARFPDRNHFASWTGSAPIDASSGEQVRHRLSRAGNRRLNHVLYIAAFVQLRNDTEGRAYYRRKVAAGKTGMEAMRCLKRRLSDVVYRQLVADAEAQREREAGPGGHSGATLTSSAADLTPHVGTSDQPQPGPAPATLPAPPTDTPARPSTAAAKRRRARGVNVEPHRTNDVHADQRRRTIPALETALLTALTIEGSHERAF